jgi:FkbM family methyltransferase
MMAMNFGALLRALPADLRIVLADVGSIGGIHARWRPVRPIVSGLLFDPREGGEVRRDGPDTVYPIALGPQAGHATLNVLALPNMSSTLLPNRPRIDSYRKKGAHTQVTSTFEMPVDTLDAIATKDGRPVDAIKVDTQGSEIGILGGGVATLGRSVILAEVEVSFFQRYAGQALAWDIVRFMGEQGFELLDLSRLKRYRRVNSVGIGNRSLGRGQRAGQLAYGDALFMMTEERLLARIAGETPAQAEATALKAIVGLLVYGKADMAAHLFDLTRDAVDPARAEKAAAFLKAMGRGPLKTGVLHHMFDYLARHA